MAITAERIVGNMSANQASGEMARIQGEIPDPTFGYLRGSSIGYQRMVNALRGGLLARNLINLVYVDKLGRGESAVPFMCEGEAARVDIIWDTREDGGEDAISGHPRNPCY